MSDGEAGVPFGAALRRHRLAGGLSLSDLAKRVHYSKGHISKVETGRRGPSPDLAKRCDAALGANGALAGLVPPLAAGSPSALAGPTHDQWIIQVDSAGTGGFGAVAHHYPAGATVSLSPLTWAMPQAVGPWRDAGGELTSFRAMFDEMRRIGHGMAPAALLPVLIAQTHALRLLAKTSKLPARAEALFLASRFAEYTGWLAQEAGDDQGALWWTDRAVEFATACGDDELEAYAWERRGLVAMYRYDARETIAVAQRAQAAPCGARVRGLAALREAQGHALAGDYGQCQHALDRGAVLLESADAGDARQPLLGTTTVANPVAMVAGWCLHDLGRSREAILLLKDELAAVPDHAHRTRGRIGVRYSLALLADGELDEGCAVVDGLLDTITLADSATVRVDLRRLAQELNRRSTHRAVKNLMPRLIGALNTAYR
jgi:transcriptional regulator with XRE-family HTH domain